MQFEKTADTLKCIFESQLNTTVCTEIGPELANAVNTAVRESPGIRIEFDLERTEYICSAFLRLCLLHCKLVGVPRFRVSHASSNVKDVFDMAGLSEMMSIQCK